MWTNMTLHTPPLLLDLFCGGGGAAMGYSRAGFRVVGVDHVRQPHYPFEFILADAMTFPLEGWDAIHASPPCQRFTSLKSAWNALDHTDLLTPTLARLDAISVPWVVENVSGAPMRSAVQLCGSSFNLGCNGAQLRRHRLFEINWPLMAPPCAHDRARRVIGVYGGHGRDRRRRFNAQDFPTSDRRTAMGIDWMTGTELSQAIPPAYTEYIGHHLMAEVLRREGPCYR